MTNQKRVFIRSILVATALAMGAGAAFSQAKPPITLGAITALSGPFAGYGKIQEMHLRLAKFT